MGKGRPLSQLPAPSPQPGRRPPPPRATGRLGQGGRRLWTRGPAAQGEGGGVAWPPRNPEEGQRLPR